MPCFLCVPGWGQPFPERFCLVPSWGQPFPSGFSLSPVGDSHSRAVFPRPRLGTVIFSSISIIPNRGHAFFIRCRPICPENFLIPNRGKSMFQRSEALQQFGQLKQLDTVTALHQDIIIFGTVRFQFSFYLFDMLEFRIIGARFIKLLAHQPNRFDAQ